MMIHIDTFGSIKVKERRERKLGDFIEFANSSTIYV